jgi:hypothetical protein
MHISLSTPLPKTTAEPTPTYRCPEDKDRLRISRRLLDEPKHMLLEHAVLEATIPMVTIHADCTALADDVRMVVTQRAHPFIPLLRPGTIVRNRRGRALGAVLVQPEVVDGGSCAFAGVAVPVVLRTCTAIIMHHHHRTVRFRRTRRMVVDSMGVRREHAQGGARCRDGSSGLTASSHAREGCGPESPCVQFSSQQCNRCESTAGRRRSGQV